MRKPLRYLVFLAAVFGLLSMMGACTQTVVPPISHLKRPLSGAFLTTNSLMCSTLPGDLGGAFCTQDKHCATGRQCIPTQRRLLYVANADMDRLTAVDVDGTGFPFVLVGRDFSHPGIMYLRTGRYPISVAVSPDQKRMFVLHGVDGDIGVWDTEKRTQVLDDAKPLRLPRCEAQRNCWPNPRQMIVREVGGRLLGFVLIPVLQTIAVINLTEGQADYGKEVQRIALSGTPTQMILDQALARLYVTNSTRDVVHQIDLATFAAKEIYVGTLSNGGSITPDGRVLYLLDLRDGGIFMFDIAQRAQIPQGDTRFPEERNLYPQDRSAQFSTVTFLPIVDAYRQKNGNGFFAWATATSGRGFLIDGFHHRLFYETPVASVNLPVKVTINGRTPTNLAVLPQLEREPIRDTDGNVVNGEDGKPLTREAIKVFHGQTRDEIWRLTYEGQLFEVREGEFESLSAGRFVDKDLNLQEEGVKVDDQLVLYQQRSLTSCKCAILASFAEPASQEALRSCSYRLGESCEFVVCTGELDGEDIPKMDCPLYQLPIKEVSGHRVVIERGDAVLPPPARWRYAVRAKSAFVAAGSATGVLKERTKVGESLVTPYFSLKILQGESADIPQDTRFEFDTLSGVTLTAPSLAGVPTFAVYGEDAACEQKNGCVRLWMLDSSSNRVIHIQVNQSLQTSTVGALR